MPADQLERSLGRHIRALRLDRRLTQVELAERANVSLGALKHLEGGSGSTTTTLLKVVRALGQEQWVEGLAPSPPAFNPLDLLADRKQRADDPSLRRRVRHRSGHLPADGSRR